jgi:hypothetical protein
VQSVLAAGDNWKLSISDNGIGVPDAHAGRLGQTKSSLGTSIVKALAQRLEAGVNVLSGTHRHNRVDNARDPCGEYVSAEDHARPGRVPSRPPWPENVPVHMCRRPQGAFYAFRAHQLEPERHPAKEQHQSEKN